LCNEKEESGYYEVEDNSIDLMQKEEKQTIKSKKNMRRLQ
jgi:hypothetical protein